MALSNFKDRLSVLEKHLNKREQTKKNKEIADEAFREILNEARQLLAEHNRRIAEQETEWEQERKKRSEWFAAKTVEPEIPTTTAPKVESSLDEFETWLKEDNED